MRSDGQMRVLLDMLEGCSFHVLEAPEFRAVTGRLVEPDAEPGFFVPVDGRTVAALRKKQWIKVGKVTSPWTYVAGLTPEGRKEAKRL